MEHLPIPDLMRILFAFENGESTFKDFLPICEPCVQQLGRYLIRHPQYDDSSKSKMTAYKTVFETEYDKATMNELVKNTRKLLLTLIGHLQSKETALGQRQQAITLRKNGHYSEIDAANNRALELATKETDGVRHFVETEVFLEKYFNDGEKTDALKSKEAASNFYLVGRLKFVINDLVLCRIKDETIPKNLQEEIEQLFKWLNGIDTPYANVQIAGIKYFQNPSKELFYLFYTAYFDNFHSLVYGKDFLLIYLVNAVALLPNSDEEIRKEYSTLYNFGIKNNLLLEDGEITILRFNNVIHAGQILGDLQLIEFAKTTLIQHVLIKKNKERCESMADVYLSFGRKEYGETAKHLKKLNIDTRLPFYMRIRIQVIGFKYAYEKSPDKQHAAVYLDEKEQIFRNRLNEYVGKKIKEIRHKKHMNFLEFMNLLARRKTTPVTKVDLGKKLDSYKGVIVELLWLKEKIAELGSK